MLMVHSLLLPLTTDFVSAALQYYGEQGLLDPTPVPSSLERDKDPALRDSPLVYPGKIAADPKGNRVFISDTNNHRIIVADASTGAYIAQYGGNGSGLRDGPGTEACFNRPQGLAYDAASDRLYIADTENHALRSVDLKSGAVTTIAGNGSKGSDYKGGRIGQAQALNSPWDVVITPSPSTSSANGGGKVLVAMAGQHQIWAYDRSAAGGAGAIGVISGSGYERNQNGASALATAWAQPSGLAFSADGKEVYVADSESSAIRAMQVETGGSRLLAGGDPLFADNLFRFGDRDGFGSDALLQHPLGVTTVPSIPGKVRKNLSSFE
jgi:sugar lactone lactonase YvrE